MFPPRTWIWTRTVSALFAGACLLSRALAEPGPTRTPSGYKITTIPAQFDKGCRQGRAKLYDECLDQSSIFETAKQRAAAENKVLLVSLRKPDRLRRSSSARNETSKRTRRR
jgi:hypothetical protein